MCEPFSHVCSMTTTAFRGARSHIAAVRRCRLGLRPGSRQNRGGHASNTILLARIERFHARRFYFDFISSNGGNGTTLMNGR